MTILATIEETLDTLDTKITWQDIAKAAGITKSALSHFKSGTELKFHTLLKIAKYVFKNNYFETFKTWCLTLSQPKNIRFALEYLALNRQHVELGELIEKIRKEYSTKELTDWADTYSILLSYLKGEEPSEVLNIARKHCPKTPETKILQAMIITYCKIKLREYTSISPVIDDLQNAIEEIKDDYIRESFKIRISEILAYVSLHLNNPEEARKHAKAIISSDICATLSAHSYYIVGMSYLFSNYDECLGNIIKYRESLINLERDKEVKIVDNNDLPFINSVWGKHARRPETDDISEVGHYEAKYGNKELALELIEKSIEEDGVSGFKLYYKALATNDKALFMQSLIYFVNVKGDKFFANLPYEKLKDDAVFAPMADLMMVEQNK